MKREDIGFFDAEAEFCIVERLLPHWSQAGTLCFITWRLADSLPKEVLARIDAEIAAFLRRENLPTDGDWNRELRQRDGYLVPVLHFSLECGDLAPLWIAERRK